MIFRHKYQATSVQVLSPKTMKKKESLSHFSTQPKRVRTIAVTKALIALDLIDCFDIILSFLLYPPILTDLLIVDNEYFAFWRYFYRHSLPVLLAGLTPRAFTPFM